jgi:single-strand DNA-binding protein
MKQLSKEEKMRMDKGIPGFVSGNLIKDPELSFTRFGVPKCTFTLAVNHGSYQEGKWKEEEPTFISVTAWRELAENVNESLNKGDGVVVSYLMKQARYTARDGSQASRLVFTATDVGASLKRATMQPTRNPRQDHESEPTPPVIPAGEVEAPSESTPPVPDPPQPEQVAFEGVGGLGE